MGSTPAMASGPVVQRKGISARRLLLLLPALMMGTVAFASAERLPADSTDKPATYRGVDNPHHNHALPNDSQETTGYGPLDRAERCQTIISGAKAGACKDYDVAGDAASKAQERRARSLAPLIVPVAFDFGEFINRRNQRCHRTDLGRGARAR
jgi:hypothetical protein